LIGTLKTRHGWTTSLTVITKNTTKNNTLIDNQNSQHKKSWHIRASDMPAFF
jgi:hypothetical protein